MVFLIKILFLVVVYEPSRKILIIKKISIEYYQIFDTKMTQNDLRCKRYSTKIELLLSQEIQQSFQTEEHTNGVKSTTTDR